MDDIRVNGRLSWICMGTLAWCVIKAAEYACNRCISWPSLWSNQKNTHLVIISSGMTSQLQPSDKVLSYLTLVPCTRKYSLCIPVSLSTNDFVWRSLHCINCFFFSCWRNSSCFCRCLLFLSNLRSWSADCRQVLGDMAVMCVLELGTEEDTLNGWCNSQAYTSV
jgi:hypothetical protein